MPFYFLKYLQPAHYFRLKNTFGKSVFPKVEYLPKSIMILLNKDGNYQSNFSQDYDLSWQAVQKGYIGGVETYTEFVELPLADHYRFARKYFNPIWVFFILVVRLLSLHNPIKELRSWVSTRRVKRSIFRKPINYKAWDDFESQLIKETPLVSVIIPTLNRYEYLKDVLKDLEGQDYPHFEVVVVDQSEPFQSEFYKDFDLKMTIIRQEEKALWLARNTAIEKAQGTLIALSEDDVRIASDWIRLHLKCLDFFDAHVSAGVFHPVGQEIPKDRAFFAIASQFATGNAMLYKSVFKSVGLFDRQFEKQRMGDGEFGMRVYLEGIRSISNPLASCIDVKAGTGGLREMGSWDAFRPATFFAPRPIPSVIYYFRRYFGTAATKMALLRMVPLSIFPYQFKKNKPLLVIGVFLTVLLIPLVLYQVAKAWRLATIKLKEGPKIPELD